MLPSMSIAESPRVVPELAMRDLEVRVPIRLQRLDDLAQHRRPLAIAERAQARARPRSRAYAKALARSTPSLETRTSAAPVTGSCRVVPAPAPSTQRPPT